MLLSLALLLIVGFVAMKIVSYFRLPGLIGLLIVGALLGPHVLGLLDQNLLLVSQDLRQFALIIILIRAGLGLQWQQLKKVGRSALKISLIPCLLEGVTVMLVSHLLLDFTLIEGGMLGFILAAVSPAVVVPSMIELEESGYGTNKGIPTLLLAGTSIDDVFAITIFSFFFASATGVEQSILSVLAKIPYSIIGGIIGGIIVALLMLPLIRSKHITLKHTELLLILLTFATLYFYIGESLQLASLLGVMVLGFVILDRAPAQAKIFSRQLAAIWVFAQIILFALVGAEVNIKVAIEAGLIGLVIIFIGLIARSVGVWLATARSNFTYKERLFCMIAYLPKATVQAAIGSLPLAAGLQSGGIILAIAVLSIVVTAPLGAIGIRLAAPHLLTQK
ncbi:cation:proton antiporter [Amphibacillus indicireducens]|uniref:Cation:proton antiporter n=1 Tax=Amphibacillus indicireducens TaxID=1076330 RepID=A0ABP7VBI1_9BACI